MERRQSADISGDWVDRINAIPDLQVEVVLMAPPDGQGQLELTRFRHPVARSAEPGPGHPDVLGIRSVMFAVDDVDDSVERLRAHGGELVGEIVQYEDLYRLCYLRGPAGIIVALAEELR